jgi:phosphohistidine phosphatase
MIFGHNPAFTDVTNRFISEDLDKLPTTGIAIVDFDVRSWKEIDKKHVRNIEIDYPKKQK